MVALRWLGWWLLGIAAVGVLLSGYLAFSQAGDISIRHECRGSALSLYVDPQATRRPLPTDISDLDVGRACNADAVRRMHRVLVLLPFILVGSVVGVVLLRRAGQATTAPTTRQRRIVAALVIGTVVSATAALLVVVLGVPSGV